MWEKVKAQRAHSLTRAECSGVDLLWVMLKNNYIFQKMEQSITKNIYIQMYIIKAHLYFLYV